MQARVKRDALRRGEVPAALHQVVREEVVLREEAQRLDGVEQFVGDMQEPRHVRERLLDQPLFHLHGIFVPGPEEVS